MTLEISPSERPETKKDKYWSSRLWRELTRIKLRNGLRDLALRKPNLDILKTS